MSRRHQFMLPTKGESTPASIPGLVVWWDAQLSTITAAINGAGAAPTDKGLAGHVSDCRGSAHALAAPADANRGDLWFDAYGYGLRAIRLNGQEFMVNSTLAETVLSGDPPTFTIVQVDTCTREVEVQQINWGVVQDGGELSGAGNTIIYSQNRTAYATAAHPKLYLSWQDSNDSSQTQTAGSSGSGSSQPRVRTTIWNANTAHQTYENDVLMVTHSGAGGNAAFTFGSGGHFTVNAIWDGSANLVSANHSSDRFWVATLIFNRAITAGERRAIERYFLGRFRIGYQAVSTLRKSWIFGSSHSEGLIANGVLPWTRRLQRMLPFNEAAIMPVRAASGARMVQAGADNDISEFYDAANGGFGVNDIVYIEAGYNDIRLEGDDTTLGDVETTADAVITALTSRLDDAINTVGVRGVVLCTPPPASTAAPASTSQNRVDGMNYLADELITLAATYTASEVQVADFFHNMKESGSNDIQTQYVLTDKIHLTNAGHALAATLAKAARDALFA